MKGALSLPVFLCIRLRVGEKQNLISLPPPPLTPFSPFLTYFPFLPLRPDISGINKKWFLLPPLPLASSGLLPGSLGERKPTIQYYTQPSEKGVKAGQEREGGRELTDREMADFYFTTSLLFLLDQL